MWPGGLPPGFAFTPELASKRKIHSFSPAQPLYFLAHEKVQLLHRCAPPLIRHLLGQFRSDSIKAGEACELLGLSRSRFYELYADYWRACAARKQEQWAPGLSGGDHSGSWPKELTDLLRIRLSSRPAASDSFAASEALRLLKVKIDRAQVRRWAIENGLAQAIPNFKPKAPVRRWQRSSIGELWPLDASPHRWFADSQFVWPMLNRLDDCSRLFTGSKIYEREILLSYLDFLPSSFRAFGRPLCIDVDYHPLFYNEPDALTPLAWALRFYDITLRFAPTPQAKGKIEREHQYWQNRLPAYFASKRIATLEMANTEIDKRRAHRHGHQTHRELNMTAQKAWNLALEEKRSVLRPVPECPWWPSIWSQRTAVKVGSDGRVSMAGQRLRVEAPPAGKVVLCQHTSGHYSVLLKNPSHQTTPRLLFTNRP